ncbi:mitochondrial translation release factor in rescue [Brevipalpus obovatus]|uniref:mitochondrial translation release factor in rescue n=1 Tax=Brevipalpus obovatus TaxID=246614 RepID=UPI003D9F738C
MPFLRSLLNIGNNRITCCCGVLLSHDFKRFGSNYLRKRLDYSLFPTLDEKDLEEQFVHGKGPGGSKVNTDRNCVVLKHKPTGLVVKCHEQRQVETNRKLARKLLLTRLDNHLNGDKSIETQTKVIFEELAAKKEAQAAELREKKKQYKELLESKLKKCSHSESLPTGLESQSSS